MTGTVICSHSAARTDGAVSSIARISAPRWARRPRSPFLALTMASLGPLGALSGLGPIFGPARWRAWPGRCPVQGRTVPLSASLVGRCGCMPFGCRPAFTMARKATVRHKPGSEGLRRRTDRRSGLTQPVWPANEIGQWTARCSAPVGTGVAGRRLPMGRIGESRPNITGRHGARRRHQTGLPCFVRRSNSADGTSPACPLALACTPVTCRAWCRAAR